MSKDIMQVLAILRQSSSEFFHPRANLQLRQRPALVSPGLFQNLHHALRMDFQVFPHRIIEPGVRDFQPLASQPLVKGVPTEMENVLMKFAQRKCAE